MIKVTGALGFIGQAVIRYCRARQIPVTGYCRSPSDDEAIVQLVDYSEIPEGGTLIHLAECRTASEVTDDVLKQQLYIVKKLLSKKFNQFVYASSAAVYKTCSEMIQTDSIEYDDKPYARGKVQCEDYVLSNGGVVARIANVYGPKMAKNNVLATILNQSYEKKIQVFNTTSIRDYIWIDDVAAALVEMALKNKKGIFHVSSGDAATVKDLIRIVCQLSENNDYYIEETQPTSLSKIVLDPSQTIIQFGWQPTISIQQGLQILLQDRS